MGSLALALVLAACGSQAPSPTDVEPSESASVQPTEQPSPGPQGTNEFDGAWVDVTADTIGETADYTNMVEVADLNGDGLVDVLFANGGNYDFPGEPALSRVFLNRGDGAFEDATASVLGDELRLTRVIKVADIDADGDPDILLGIAYDSQSRLLLNDGAGAWTDVTDPNLPAAELSAGDLEVGDVDGDRDLDIVIADWGDDGPNNGGGRVALWLNDGAGRFTDATDQMPETLIDFSWDVALVDVDNDWDLDLAVSCKLCPTSSHLFINDGAGTFTDETDDRLPASVNNYWFGPIDLDGDGFLDLVTINDGPPTPTGLSEHVFRNDGTGAFVDMTAEWWARPANSGWDDALIVAIDIESDGDADFLVASLDGPDRLMVNDGTGVLTADEDVFDADQSRGTLGMAIADFNGDGQPDVVESQGEVPGNFEERMYFGTDVLAPDTAPPIIRASMAGSAVLARIHDNRTPNAPHDWQSIVARWNGGEAPMTWYGENLFWADVPGDATDLEVCATDAAGNEACAAPE